ncbi:MAG: putative ABC transport system ATP-binding protein [Oleiphilaceae bacterium]|jgi:putative ABC transport system ATP-binding protein
MINLDNVSMNYQLEDEQVSVLSNISLSISKGESIAIVGPSGSGKTTILLLLSALETPSSGSIHIRNQKLADLSQDELADLRRDTMGIVFQSFHLIPSLDALSNVALPLEIAGRKDARRIATEMIKRVGLEHRSKHYPLQLSGGEQQRVAIARALAHSPSLVLADEPTGNLDAKTGHRISDLLFELHEDMNATLVLVTHDEQLAKRCQRIVRMSDGRLLEGAADALSA